MLDTSGMFISALIYGIVMIQFLRKEPGSAYEDQEHQASERMWEQKLTLLLARCEKQPGWKSGGSERNTAREYFVRSKQ